MKDRIPKESSPIVDGIAGQVAMMGELPAETQIALLRVLQEHGEVVLKLSGRMGGEDIDELEKLIRAEASGPRIVLDLKDLTLVDQDSVSFLRHCEGDSIQLKNCPAYIREWIRGE